MSFLWLLHVAGMCRFLSLISEDLIGNRSTCIFFSPYNWLWNARIVLMYYVRWTQIVFQHQCSICFLPFNSRSITNTHNQLHDSKWKQFIQLWRSKQPSWLEVFSLGLHPMEPELFVPPFLDTVPLYSVILSGSKRLPIKKKNCLIHWFICILLIFRN